MTLGFVRTSVREFGYGVFGLSLERGFQDLGVDLAVNEKGNVVPPTGAVLWAMPAARMKWAWEGQYTAAYCMWEATRLPESFRDNFHELDLLIVPCQQNVDIFSPYHPNVVKVPLGYDPGVWFPKPREVKDTFRILCAGAALHYEGGRKGFDLALEAFELAFPNWERMDPQPKLVTKSLKDPSVPKFVEQHVGVMPEAELVEFVHGCHMYLGPSRGEGWGYWPQQALASGMPVVMSGIPAHMEYAHVEGILTAPVTEEAAAYFVYGPAGNWWRPDVDTLASHLRAVYEHYEDYHAAAQRGAEQMREEFSHWVMCKRVMHHLSPHMDREVGEKREFTRQVFPTRVTRKVNADIGRGHYELVPDRLYHLPSDVVRVLQESGAITDLELSNGPGFV